MQNDAVVINAGHVEALARVTHTYHCAMVDHENMLEQGDGDFDLECTLLPDGRQMYEFSQDNEPELSANAEDVSQVLKLIHVAGAHLWFKKAADFEAFAAETPGVAQGDGKDLTVTEPMFSDGRLAPDWFATGFRPD